MSTLQNDLRYALRLIRGAPGFAAIAVLTLALGIGANSAMFSFVDGVLLRPLPYPHGEQIIALFEHSPRTDRANVSTLNYLDWKTQNTVFSEMAAQAGLTVSLTGTGEPVQLQGSRVSAAFLDIFGLQPLFGRSFGPDEEQPGKDQVVLISHRIWEAQFGADPHITGRKLTLDGKPFTVTGVLPAGGPFEKGLYDVWMPLAFDQKDQTRNVRWLRVWARLKPGVSLDQARAEMQARAARIEREYPDSNHGWGITLARLYDLVTAHGLRETLLILLAAVATVLLIACANLANLLLARGSARERELAIRAAMGASRGRLIRQFLVESVVLASAGGLLGLWLAYAFLGALRAWIPPLVLPPEADVHLDLRVLLFTVAIILGSGFLFGIGPALTVVRGDVAASLKETGWRATAGRGRRWLRDSLVVSEVALAFVLLSGAALLLRSFYELLRVDPGVDTANVLTMTLPMTPNRYTDSAQISSYLSHVQEKISSVPGVREVAATTVLPFRGWGWEMPFQIDGQPPTDKAARPSCFFKVVSPSYFQSLGIHLHEGRELEDSDTADSPLVLVINESMARRYFGGQDPVGKRAFLPRIVSGTRRGPDVAWEVVGVVADEKVKSLRDFSPGVYASYRQSPSLGVSLVVRASGDASRLMTDIRTAVQQLNPSQPLADIRMLDDIKSESLGSNRLRTGLLALFAFLALLLATIGIYGVLSYSVSRRTQEIGIRAALGATRGSQLRLILGNGLSLTGIGIAIGVLASLAVSGVLSSLLFGVTARDPGTLLLVGLVLGGVAAAACYLPARRATKVDPLVALRHE